MTLRVEDPIPLNAEAAVFMERRAVARRQMDASVAFAFTVGVVGTLAWSLFMVMAFTSSGMRGLLVVAGVGLVLVGVLGLAVVMSARFALERASEVDW